MSSAPILGFLLDLNRMFTGGEPIGVFDRAWARIWFGLSPALEAEGGFPLFPRKAPRRREVFGWEQATCNLLGRFFFFFFFASGSPIRSPVRAVKCESSSRYLFRRSFAQRWFLKGGGRQDKDPPRFCEQLRAGFQEMPWACLNSPKVVVFSRS